MPALSAGTVQSEEQPKPKRTYNVLFVCTENSSASIFAEALLTRWGGEFFRAFSAGTRTVEQIDPLAIEMLKGCNVWHDRLHSKTCDEFLGPLAPVMDFVFTLGSNRPPGMPSRWPGNPQVIHWRITDPAMVGKATDRTASFKAALRELETRIKLFALVCKREAIGRFAKAA